MGRSSRRQETAETEQLRATRATLPASVAAWTPEQRQRFADQSDRAMREQNGVGEPERLT